MKISVLLYKIKRRIILLLTHLNYLVKTSSTPSGKSIVAQLYEITKLKSGPTKLSVRDYSWYNMGNKEIYKNVDLGTFGGSHMTQNLHEQLNNDRWDAVVTDKLIMASVFSSSGIPQPKLYAAACQFAREAGDCKIFDNYQDLSDFLQHDIPFPFFCKPIKGGSAKGCNRVESFDPVKQKLLLTNGQYTTIHSFLSSLKDPSGWGFLFQEAVLPHPDTIDICGDSVSGCRVIMLLDDKGAKPFRIVWKLPAGGNYVDNYVSGTTGNLLADVDLDTGRVVRVVSGFGASLEINPKHPDKDIDIVGMKVPDWEAMIQVVKRAAKYFPGFRLQHWDIGLTSKGPIVYELNTAGHLDLAELVRGTGVYDEELKEFIRKYAQNGRRSSFIGTTPVSIN